MPEPCPWCSSPLRPFLRRLVCDRCGGILIERADLAGQFHARVEALPDTPTERWCPRCRRRLQACLLSIGEETLFDDVWMCSRDGLWLNGGLLESVLSSGLGD